MGLSTLPILVFVIFGFLWLLTLRLHRRRRLSAAERNRLGVLLLALLAWGGLVGYLAVRGGLASERFLGMMPGYWMPYVPVVVAVVLTTTSVSLRNAIGILVDETPQHWLTGIHVLRILAIGTLVKASMGLFPEKFAWFVGGPDLLFGLSAAVVTLLVLAGRLSERFLKLWHAAGALVILIPVVGLMHIFAREPLFAELFVFPMVLAPALVVPTLVMLNLMVALRLMEKGRAMTPSAAPRP